MKITEIFQKPIVGMVLLIGFILMTTLQLNTCASNSEIRKENRALKKDKKLLRLEKAELEKVYSQLEEEKDSITASYIKQVLTENKIISDEANNLDNMSRDSIKSILSELRHPLR